MLDGAASELLKKVSEACRDEAFYRAHRDICIAARLALLNVKGGGVKLRPSLLRLESLSDKKAASYVLREIRREVGPVTDGESLKRAAAALVYRRLAERL
ncbi:hypothetical protein [Pyrobaculum neutrophilum]|uniref:Uncharacterized protein n=1 Tax=Pyrobaculum neutrophilum (strain DSM 2338 / JCM 9278 / NBRC 100436 / V24Sta) TaxID=444157 RepID=B1Y8S2_PYRNV|nr:hypothetical protein [Pyrobaculum neutrophilum]ACB40151.1 conserved hypothetical protein [Pyrobaculum neutrophilum V24Sta]